MLKTTLIALILAAGLLAFAQQPTPADFEPVLAMPLRVEFVKGLNSVTAHVGDAVQLRWFGEIKKGSGTLVLLNDAKVYGHVSDVAKRDKNQLEARLGIIVDRAEVAGTTLKLDAVFCGGFRTAPQFVYKEAHEFGSKEKVLTIGPGTTGLPPNVELRRPSDASLGAVLASKKDNINIAAGTGFYVCDRASHSLLPKDPRPVVVPPSLPTGVTFAVALNTAIDTGNAKPGDRVSMMMIDNLRGPGNTIAIPRGASIVGRIVVAEPSSKNSPSRLGILAEQAAWDEGTVPLKAFASSPPVWRPFEVPEMIRRGVIVSIDSRTPMLERIALEKTSDGIIFTRPKSTINLPAGSIFTIRQAE